MNRPYGFEWNLLNLCPKPWGRLRKFWWPSQKNWTLKEKVQNSLRNAEPNLFAKKETKTDVIMIDNIVDWCFDLVFWANLSQKKLQWNMWRKYFVLWGLIVPLMFETCLSREGNFSLDSPKLNNIQGIYFVWKLSELKENSDNLWSMGNPKRLEKNPERCNPMK